MLLKSVKNSKRAVSTIDVVILIHVYVYIRSNFYKV
jgi:hypothetical protein